MSGIEHWAIDITLKLMRAKPIRKETIETMRACLAIHHHGWPITTSLLGAVMGREEGPESYNLSSRLHLLGDKNALILRRGSRGRELKWHVSPTFMKIYGEDRK